jgi:multidrug efflux pump subunit AcrB
LQLSVRAAAIEAGKRRMRPIFLTSAAASMGVLPMISMVLVVTVLPVSYWLLFRKEDKKELIIAVR